MKNLILLLFLIMPGWLFSQQVADTTYNPSIQSPVYEAGKGKVVAFGEAAMFTAQLAGPQKQKAGMNNEVAPENF